MEDTGSAKRTACLCCVLVFEKECLTLPCGADTCLCQTQASAKRTARVCCVLLVCLWSCSTLPGGSDRPRISNPSCTSHNHAPPQTRTGLGVWHAHTHTHTLTHTRNPGPPSPALTHVFRTQAAPHITTPLHKPAQARCTACSHAHKALAHPSTHTHHPPRGVEKSRRPQLHCTARSGSTTTHTHTHTQTATARCLRQNTASQEEGA